MALKLVFWTEDLNDFKDMKKQRLKFLAVYRERFTNTNISSQPSIENYKDALTNEFVCEILKYLESDGFLQLEFVSQTQDTYSGDSIPFFIYSDGVYVWDTTLIHWVQKYRIQLPRVFLEHFSIYKGIIAKELKYNVDIRKKQEMIFLEKSHYLFKR